MNIFLLFIFLIIFPQTFLYEYELVKEYETKIINFDFGSQNSYKIYKYTPSSIGNTSIKNIIVQFIYGEINLLMFENLSDIIIEKDGINENKSIPYEFEESYIFYNLTCGKDYFLIFSYIKDPPEYYAIPSYSQFTIINEEIESINISPITSKYFSLIPRQNTNETFIYYFNETRNILIHFEKESILTIYENNTLIYENITKLFSKIFEFKKDTNYAIYYDCKKCHYYDIDRISFQIYDESKYFKLDVNNPIVLLNYNYQFEFDISKYKINDYIIFTLFGEYAIKVKYQYKSIFNGNNYVDLGLYKSINNILIKKNNNDTAIILNFQFQNYYSFSLLKLIEYEIEELTENYNNPKIKGPKLFIVDYLNYNNMNSIGFKSNKGFYFYEQSLDGPVNPIQTTLNYYKNLYITKVKEYHSQLYKRAFIYINSTDEISFQVYKFNFSILNRVQNEYFQLCQENNNKNELYFYVPRSMYEFFILVYGEFYPYFIYESEINDFTDLTFEESDKNYFKSKMENVYLKIKCNKPTMIKHLYISDNCYQYFRKYEPNELLFNIEPGKKYIISSYKIIYISYFKFDSNLNNKIIELKFNILGFDIIETIELIIDNKEYTFMKSNSTLELNYTVKSEEEKDFYFKFKSEDIIKHNKTITDCFYYDNIMLEIIVGRLPENLTEIKQINFGDSIGNLTIEENKDLIIKIPKDFKENLYNYEFIIPIIYNSLYFKFEILYDKLSFIVPTEAYLHYASINSLFNNNPYNYILNNTTKSENKYFYILIGKDSRYSNYKYNLFIKKPKLLSDYQLNKINSLPKLTKENNQYYYQIELSKKNIKNNSSLYIQILSGEFFFSQNHINYLFLNEIELNTKKDFFILPIYFKDESQSMYINYYSLNDSEGYINIFEETNQKIYMDDHPIKLNPTIIQIDGTNKINITMNSLAYVLYPNEIKYYFLINSGSQYIDMYSLIEEQKKINKDIFIEVKEDGGHKKTLKYEIEIDKKLRNNNSIYIVPVNKKNNFVHNNYITYMSFNFEYHSNGKTKIWLIIIIIISSLLIILAILIIYYLFKRRKKEIPKIEENSLLELKNKD